jgi:hypothetical protein
MDFLSRAIQIGVIAGMGVITIAGCDQKRSNPAPSAPVSGHASGGSGSGGSSGASGLHAATLDKAYCVNQNSLEVANGQLIDAKDSVFKKGRLNLTTLDVYVLAAATNDSFAVVAESERNFSATLECNGMSDLKDANYHRHSVAGDGEEQDETAASTRNLSGSATFPEWINLRDHKNSPISKQLKGAFENGKLVSAGTVDQPTTPTSDDSSGSFSAPVDHLQVAPDTYVSVRMYKLNERQIELRVQFEFPNGNDDGSEVVLSSRAVYTVVQ